MKSASFEPLTYPQLLELFRSIHRVSDERYRAFEGRIINFRRLGIGFIRTGHGNKIAYNAEMVWVLAFALELAQLGIQPKAILAIVDRWKREIISAFTSSNETSSWVTLSHDVLVEPSSPCGRFNWGSEFPVDAGRHFVAVDVSRLSNDIENAISALKE